MTSVPKNSVKTFPQKVRTVLLQDQGPHLPLGIPDTGGTYRGDLVCKPWTMREEKELGKLRDRNRDKTMFKYVSMVLATMYERIGPHDFSDMKFDERRLRVGQMYTGNVYYAYMWLRVQALGPELEMELVCPICTSKFFFPADLETTEVATAPVLGPFLWSYDLHNPLVIRDKDVRALVMGPSLWQTLENMSGQGGLNIGEGKAAMIRGSVVELEGLGAVSLAGNELDGMTKWDIEAIVNCLVEHRLGPNMAIEDLCPHCSRPFKLPIDWGYDSFFGGSSR